MRQSVPRFASIQQSGELVSRKALWYRTDLTAINAFANAITDESLKLLQPTLPAPGTCDIIDINPGVCVWSEAVHDFLKPRRHVLVEKNRKQYADFFEPLLERAGSAYRYAPDLRTAISSTSGLLSEEAMNTFETANEGKGLTKRRALENSSLLVIANLTRSAQAPGFSGTAARRFLNNYYRSLCDQNEYIHRYGLVRLIAWMDESSRRSILPTGVAGQTKQSVQLEAAFDIVEVAGPDIHANTASTVRRWYQLNDENFEDVRSHETKMGLEIPKNRISEPPPRPLQYYPPSSSFLADHQSWFPKSHRFIQDLLAVETRLAIDKPEWLHAYTMRLKNGNLSPGHPRESVMVNKSADQKLYRRLMNQLQTYHNNFHKLNDIIAQHRSLWKQFKSLGTPVTHQQIEAQQQLIAQQDALDAKTSALKHDNRVVVSKAIDDYRAYDCNPRALSWNRRRFEPLRAYSEEFYPHHSLSLLDFRPRPGFLERLNTVDKIICFDYLVTNLSIYRFDTVSQAIQRLTGSSYKEFLAAMPDLGDIEKGGWYKLEDLRLRSLPWQFYVRFAELFEQWPQRPPVERLISTRHTVFDNVI